MQNIAFEKMMQAKLKNCTKEQLRHIADDKTQPHWQIAEERCNEIERLEEIHELLNKRVPEEEENDKHLRKAIEQLYQKDEEVTYELKLYKGGEHEREKLVPHNIHQ